MEAQKPTCPWRIVKSSKPQVHGDFFVVRDLLVDASNSHYEQLCDENGAVKNFFSAAEAQAAIDTFATPSDPTSAAKE